MERIEWTAEQDSKLVTMYRGGKTWQQISKRLKANPGDVALRMSEIAVEMIGEMRKEKAPATRKHCKGRQEIKIYQ